MTKELKIMTIAGLIFLSFFAYSSIKTEYARITSRVETTQAKVDALADELHATTTTIHAAIRSLTDRFLAGEGQETGLANEASPVKATITKPDAGIPASTTPTILMHSSPTCGPCLRWKNNELERWTKAGWQVALLDEENCERAKWPWYEITDRDGSQFEVVGPLTNDNFQAAKAGAK